MAEAIGFAASVIAVVGLAGQVIQGCQNIKALVGGFSNAPKDVKDLIEELNSIEESVKITDMLRLKIARREVDLQITPALQQCLDAVQELRSFIDDANIVFQETSQSKKSRGWQRLKVVLGKPAIKASIERLSRAKLQLMVVQSNVLIYFSQYQQEQLENINQSLSQSLRTSQNSASVLDCIYETTKGLCHQKENTTAILASVDADVKRYLEESQRSCNMSDMVETLEKKMERLLQKYTSQTSDAYEIREKTKAASCISIGMVEHDTPRQKLNAALLGPYYHTKRNFLCQNSFLTVSRITATADVQLEEIEEADAIEKTRVGDKSYRYVTTLEILMDFKLWRRGLKAVIGCPRRPSSSNFDLRLSTYHIVDRNSPIFHAAESFDIETVRTLFTSGRASPFDQTTEGYSLFDSVFHCLCRSYVINDATQGLRMLEFLVYCGGAPISLANKRDHYNVPWVQSAMAERIPPKIQQIVAEAVRLVSRISSQDPISNWDIGICMTLKSQRAPVGQAIKQQNQWPVQLRPIVKHHLDKAFFVVENDRLILEDEDGLLIAPFLMVAKPYVAINPTKRAWTSLSGIYSILYLYHNSEFKNEIYIGCRKRINILLKAGSDPRAIKYCEVNEKVWSLLKMSVTQYALFINTLDLWQEALESAGWSRADIENLLDEEKYLGVPALFDRELEFKSKAESRKEFLQVVAAGGYHDDPYQISKSLAIYLDMSTADVFSTIQEAHQTFREKCTPGSWPEDRADKLVFGVDFFLIRWGTYGNLRYASFDEYDKNTVEIDTQGA